MLVRSELNLDLKNIKQEQAKFWKQHPTLVKTELLVQAQLTREFATLSPSLSSDFRRISETAPRLLEELTKMGISGAAAAAAIKLGKRPENAENSFCKLGLILNLIGKRVFDSLLFVFQVFSRCLVELSPYVFGLNNVVPFHCIKHAVEVFNCGRVNNN